MTWQLGLGYLKAVIWPAVVLILGFVFRRQLTALLTRIESLQTPVGSATFQSQAEAVGREVAEEQSALIADLGSVEGALAEPESAAQEDEPQDSHAIATSAEDIGSAMRSPREDLRYSYRRARAEPLLFTELENLAASDPTAAVLGGWREVESALHAASIDSFRSEQTSSATMLRVLARQGVLPESVIRSARDLRELRDRVVHSSDLILTREGAHSYLQSARRVVDAIALARTPELRARNYEVALQSALWRISADVVTYPNGRNGAVDFTTRDMTGRGAVVQAKYFSREGFLMPRSLVAREIDRVESSGIPGGLLVVTNVRLGESVRALNTGEGNWSRPVEVVQWNSPDDDSILTRALARVSQDLESS